MLRTWAAQLRGGMRPVRPRPRPWAQGLVLAYRSRSSSSGGGRASRSTSSLAEQQALGSGAALLSHPRRDFLEARQVSLYELFEGSHNIFDVPDYQRSYAWKAKQVHELLADLQQAYVTKQEHFLGAIVTTRRSDQPGEPYWVIDGQQRLTTLIMLLCYLRSWAAATPGLETLAARVEHMLHIPRDPLNTASAARYRLRPRAVDFDFMLDNFYMNFLPRKYHLSLRLDSPANAGSDYHGAAPAPAPPGAAGQQAPPRRRRSSSSSRGAVGDGAAARSEAREALARGAAAAVPGHPLPPLAALHAQPGMLAEPGAQSVPCENESHWRLYCAGDVLACYLAQAMDAGLNLQEFAHYVLRNCVVVLLTARDEATSFKIFSTLNGRGLDLAAIDKLKPELLQALPLSERSSYAHRWSVLESALGRPSFHALFDHYVGIERAQAALQGQQQQQQQQQQWLGQPGGNGAASNGAAGNGAGRGYVPPGSTLIHHQRAAAAAAAAAAATAASGGGAAAAAVGRGKGAPPPQQLPPPPPRPDVLQHFNSERHRSNMAGVLNLILAYGERLLDIRTNDWSELAAEGGSAPAVAAELEEACFFINLLASDDWQPWALEFFHQSADDAKRAAFLRGAELLSLFCELKQDEGFRHSRWLAVGTQLLQRPFYSDQVLAALALSPDETDEFVKLLDSRELAASADESVLVHLLLRADSINRRSLDWRRLRVEKVVPSNPPERCSQWRKTKLVLPDADGTASSSSSWPHPAGRSRSSSSSGSGSGRRSGRGSDSSSSAGAALALDDGGAAAGSSGGSPSSRGRGSSSSSSVPGMREVRYWHEITRSHWHNRLGNLVLLQPSGHEATATAHLSADLPVKLQHWAACAGDEHFPEFTGGLINGRYSADMFSPDECRTRHGDIIARLLAVFGLSSERGGL